MQATSTDTLTWKDVLADEKQKPYFQAILQSIQSELAAGKNIYPKQCDIFNALKLTPFSDVKVVIIGQDPYHGPGQAHGLSFSVPRGVRPPPSLVNIFKELKTDLNIDRPNHGCLESWAQQGVLLLNSVLTVEARTPQSHGQLGWQQFTDKVIDCLNQHPKGIVFLLWGSYAQRKGENINTDKHLVLQCAHPSPFSAHRGFLGCRHFSKANQWLEAHGRTPIDWGHF